MVAIRFSKSSHPIQQWITRNEIDHKKLIRYNADDKRGNFGKWKIFQRQNESRQLSSVLKEFYLRNFISRPKFCLNVFLNLQQLHKLKILLV